MLPISRPTENSPRPARDDIRAQLERVLAGASFARSRRMSEFLRFIVHEALEGRGAELKEYRIGTAVYGRPDSFDPVVDTIVRVEARRLRASLRAFYDEEGRLDPIRIDVPKGGYEPVFLPNTPPGPLETRPPHGHTIAVLPFEDFSAARDQGHFCDGLTEEVINALSRLREVQVVARTSAFAFKGQPVDVRLIGRTLKATAVIEGSVRTQGRRRRIAAQLIDVETGLQVWSQRLDWDHEDVFHLQETCARTIASHLVPGGRPGVSAC